MNIWPSLLVSLFLLLVAVGLMILHYRTWSLAQKQELDGDAQKYRRRQFRRRMQTSALMGVLAVALFVGRLIIGPPLVGPKWLVVVFWAGVMLVLGCVFLLALLDIWATKYHFGRLRQTYQIEQTKLKAELRRIQATRGNGRARSKDYGRQRPG